MTKERKNQFLDKLKKKDSEKVDSIINNDPIGIEGEFKAPDAENTSIESTTKPQETRELSNLNLSRKPADASSEESSGFSIPDELMIAGVPLVVSALMGDIGTGAGLASKGLMQSEQEKMDFRKNLEKKKASGVGTLYKVVTDPETGASKYVTADQAVGETPADYVNTMGLRSDFRIKEAQDKADIFVDKFKKQEKIKGNIGESYEGMEINAKDIKDADIARKRFDAYAKKPVEALNTSKKIRSLLKLSKNKKNVVAYQSAVKEFAKILEGGGRLTDFDVKFVTSRLGYIREASKMAWEERTGQPVPRIVHEIEQAMKDIEQETLRAVNRTAEKIATGISSSRKGYESSKKNWLLKNLDIAPNVESDQEEMITIRNKKTGEIKRIPKSQAGKYVK